MHCSVILSRILTCSVCGDNLFFRMVESFVEQIEALEEKIAKLSAGAVIKRHAVKDLSVFTLIPEFTSRPRDLKVREFLDALHSVGRMGSWIDDKKYAATLKLGGVFF